MGLMLSVLVMCVGVLEAISSVQHIRESFLPLDTTRKKRRMVVDLGTGTVRHADISWPGDIPRGSHVIKKRSGFTSPHSSFDVPDDDHLSRRYSNHFDSAQLERAVSAILLEEDNSSDETSEEVTQILSGVVQSRIEFPIKQSRVPQKPVSPPKRSSHDIFAPINEPRHDAEPVPGKRPLLASEAVEADIVDLKPAERLIKYSSAEMGLDDYDSSESSEKYSQEKISVSNSETSVSYGSELPSSSLSSEVLVDEERKSKQFEVSSISGDEVVDIPVKDEMVAVANDPDSDETISDLIESTNDVLLSEDIISLCPPRQLSLPETAQPEVQSTSETHQSLTVNQVSTLRNDDEQIESNEFETSTNQESIVELIESTNNIVFSDDARPTLQHSDSIVELIHSTNSLVFVPETVSQENEGLRANVERQESIEKLIKSTNNVILCQDVVENQDLIPPNNTAADSNDVEMRRTGKSLDDKGEMLIEFSEQDSTVTNHDGAQIEERDATSRAVGLAEGMAGQTSLTHRSGDETPNNSAEISNDGEAAISAFCDTKPVKSDTSLSMLPDVTEINLEPVEVGEQVSSLGASVEHAFVPIVEQSETCTIDETKAVTVENDSLLEEILDTSSSECLGTFGSTDEIDVGKSKTVTLPIQTSSSSEEDDSANSVTTIITECVHTIVDIGPSPKITDGKDEHTFGHDTNEMSCTAAFNQTQVQEVITTTPSKIEEFESVEALTRSDENKYEKHTIGVQNDPRNDDLLMKTEDVTTDSPSPQSRGDDALTTKTEDMVNDDASSPESISVNYGPIIVTSKLPLPKVDETIIAEKPVQFEEQLVHEGDSAHDSLIQKSTFLNEIVVAEQQDGFIIEDESKLVNNQPKQESGEVDTESTSQKQPDDGKIVGSIQPGLIEENIGSINKGASQLEIIGGEKGLKESLSHVPSIAEEPTTLQHDAVTLQGEFQTSNEIQTHPDEHKSIVLKSESIALTATNVECDTHKLTKSGTSNEYTETALVFESDAASGTEIVGGTNVITEEIQTRDPQESSQMDSEIRESRNPQLHDTRELAINPNEDGAIEKAESTTKTEHIESASVVDSDNSASALIETEVDEERRVVSKNIESSMMDLKNSKTQNQHLRDTRKLVIDSAGDDINNLAERATENDGTESVSVVDSGKFAHTPSETEVARETPVVNEKILSRDGGSGSSKIDSQVIKKQDKNRTGSQESTTDLQTVPINSVKQVYHGDKTQDTGDGRTTNEFATDSRTSASEVQQELRRVSSIDEGEVINVKPSQNRPAEMEDVQDAPSTSPDKAFWLIFSGEYTKAMSKDWHSGHFCCWQCDESLTGQRYVLRDDHPYCIKCYESVFANTCDECNKTIGIDSKDLSYKDKHWHEACFFCNKCRVSLVDKQFGSKADKIYCGNCYDAQFASRCDGCGQIFRAGTKKMEYKTRQWHEQCFCCCVCKSAIGTKSFIPREQEIYCATCYEEKFATRCVKCNKIITSGGVTYKNEPWHRECFTCTNCNTSLAGQRFTSRDEKPYCADCFGELFAKRCTSCCKPITGIGGTRFISFEDRHWHNDCFICASCKTSLVGRGFITDAEDILCTECAKQKLM